MVACVRDSPLSQGHLIGARTCLVLMPVGPLVYWKEEMHKEFWCRNLLERNQLEDQEGGEEVILTFMYEKCVNRM